MLKNSNPRPGYRKDSDKLEKKHVNALHFTLCQRGIFTRKFLHFFSTGQTELTYKIARLATGKTKPHRQCYPSLTVHVQQKLFQTESQ